MGNGMNQPDWEALARYVVGESPPEEVEQLETRLAAHPADKALLDALAQASQRMAADIPTNLDVESALRRVKARSNETTGRPLEFRRPLVDARREVHWRVPLPAIAAAAGIPVSTHLYPEVGAHVMRVTETAHWLEWQDWADPILERPFAIEGGQLHLRPDRVGAGRLRLYANCVAVAP